jgi:hypothetical protein
MKVRIVAVLLAIVLLMSSCRAVVPDHNEDLDPPETNFPSDLDIRKVSHLFDREFGLWHGAETSFGYYEYVQRQVDGFSVEDYTHSGNLIFTDYRTEQMIYLCGVPGCAHNNVNCTSYIEFSNGLIIVPDYGEKNIIIISLGTNYKDITSDFQLASISIMDLDGSNRRELIRLKASEMISDEDELYADNQDHLYYVVVVGQTGKELRRIDLNTGTEEVLLSTGIAVVSRHSFGDNILLDYYGKTPSQVKLFSVSTKQLIDKKTVSKGYLSVVPFSHYYMAYFNEDIYNPDTTRVNLSIFDYETDEVVSVIKDLPCAPEFYCDQHVFDNNSKIEWLFMDKEENRNAYIVDLETGECSQCLRYYNSRRENTWPVSILAETGDGRLLVIMDSKQATMTQIDPQGVPHLFDLGYSRVTALISVKDYCEGIPNYHTIDCKIIDFKS